ncbi:hypothetical protein WMY93_032787 [Mugilogobius chulae]|uniref:PiggyBac transposable element-derived protein domain-containing protein n=1 Tax=Mugilogobius chulae TaxID=88201 RepID=A0AAW0MM40_9GOBI
MSIQSQLLRVLVNERLTAAAEEIFALFERTIAEVEDELCRSKEENRRKQELLDAVLNPRVVLRKPGEIHSTSPEPGLDRALDQETPQISWIKEEPEEQMVKQEQQQLLVQVPVLIPESSTEESLLLEQSQTEHKDEMQEEDICAETHDFEENDVVSSELMLQLANTSEGQTESALVNRSLDQETLQTAWITEEQRVKQEQQQLPVQKRKMDAKSFYGSRPQSFLALVPEDPQDSEADLSDDDYDIIGDLDYLTKQVEVIGDLSTEFMDEEKMPSTSTSAKKKKTVKNTLKKVMEELDEAPVSPPCTKKKKMTEKKEKESSRIWEHVDIDEFQMLFTDEMILHIAHQTNLYSAHKLGDPIKTNPSEIEDFLAVLLFMGVFNFPAMEDYWHPASRFNLIADIMPKRRFTLLQRYIHFNDDQQCDGSLDRFYKIRPLFEMLRKQCLLIPSTYKHSVDEVMVSYNGTRAGNVRQYVANKPDKCGFKVFCRASSSGIIHDLLLYQGPSTFFNVDLSEEEQELPLASKVVTTLCKTISQPRISVVFCDNYFTSFDLVLSLHVNLGIKCIGTVRSNCIGGAQLIELMKKGRGALDCKCPSLIAAYNKHISGIDLSDMLVHLYKTPAKSRRWYFPLFGYALDLCISNSWLVYKRDCDLLMEKPMSLKMFRLAVAHSLKQVNKPAPRVGRPSSTSPPPQMYCEKKRLPPRPPQPQPDIRYDNYGHWPLHTDNRGRCSLCPKGKTLWRHLRNVHNHSIRGKSKAKQSKDNSSFKPAKPSEKQETFESITPDKEKPTTESQTTPHLQQTHLKPQQSKAVSRKLARGNVGGPMLKPKYRSSLRRPDWHHWSPILEPGLGWELAGVLAHGTKPGPARKGNLEPPSYKPGQVQSVLGGGRGEVPRRPKPCARSLALGTWNVTSLAAKKPELGQKVEHFRLDKVCLTSTHSLGSETITLERGWTLHFSGVAHGVRRRAGVGLLIAPQLSRRVLEFTPVDERVASLRLRVGDRSLTVVAPTGQTTVRSTRPSWSPWKGNAPPDLNPSGVLFLDVCASYSLSMTNTMFQHKGVHQCTWHQDTLGMRVMIEFVVVSSELRPRVLNTRVKRRAELSTDYHLVMSWIRWQRRKPDRLGRAKRIMRVCWERLVVLCQPGLQLTPPEELLPAPG